MAEVGVPLGQERVRAHVVVSGRVQGVFFRAETSRLARSRGVAGWVRNLPDGRVEVAADGETDSVERFERAIRHGPRGARVDEVEVFDDVPGTSAGFGIR